MKSGGLRIAVPSDVAADVRGTTIDFVDEETGRGFKFITPADE